VLEQSVTVLDEIYQEVKEDTKVIIAEVDEVGESEPFSFEKLSPVLAMYKASSFEEAVDNAVELVRFGGIGHPLISELKELYIKAYKEDLIEE